MNKKEQIDAFTKELETLVITGNLRQCNIFKLYEKYPKATISIHQLLPIVEKQLNKETYEAEPVDLEIKYLSLLKNFSNPLVGFSITIISGIHMCLNNWPTPSVFNTMMAFIIFLLQLAVYPHIKKAFEGMKNNE